MNKRRYAQAMALALSFLQIVPATAQNSNPQPQAAPSPTTQDRSPRVNYNSGFWNRHEFQPGSVSNPEFHDSPRVGDLIREGQLYLSLEDAIAMALENNLDLELQRYGVRMAASDTLRAQGGGILRGVPLTVSEAPAASEGRVAVHSSRPRLRVRHRNQPFR